MQMHSCAVEMKKQHNVLKERMEHIAAMGGLAHTPELFGVILA